jgi:hypothetical protein
MRGHVPFTGNSSEGSDAQALPSLFYWILMGTIPKTELQMRDGHYVHPKWGYLCCGADTREGVDGVCMDKAGKRTGHLGLGRCWKHGGTTQTFDSLVKRYGIQAHIQFPQIKELVEKLSQDRDVFDFRDHIYALEAISIYLMNNSKLIDSAKILVEVTKAMERLHLMEVGRKQVITIVDVAKILDQCITIFDRYVKDEKTRALIGADFAKIRINGGEPTGRQLIESVDYEEIEE